eukprot:COSAG02_NODE_705_length_18261_cov_45.441716_2_plen_149_part_00
MDIAWTYAMRVAPNIAGVNLVPCACFGHLWIWSKRVQTVTCLQPPVIQELRAFQCERDRLARGANANWQLRQLAGEGGRARAPRSPPAGRHVARRRGQHAEHQPHGSTQGHAVSTVVMMILVSSVLIWAQGCCGADGRLTKTSPGTDF